MICVAGISTLATPVNAASAAAAQPPIDAGALTQELQREAPAIPPLAAPSTNRPALTPPSPADGVATVAVSRFQLKGLSATDEPVVQQALQRWLDRPLSFDDLKAACEAVEALYRSRGQLVLASLPPQKVQDGVVTIQVVKAQLGAVMVDTPQGLNRFTPERAAAYIRRANRVGEAIDLKAVERAVAILKETPGLTATSVLEAGAQEGQVDFHLTLKETPLLTGRVDLSNSGSASTGAGQTQVLSAVNNPMGWGDQLTLTGVFSAGSHFGVGSYGMPVGTSGLRALFAIAVLGYRNQGEFEANGATGSSATLTAGLTYPLLRSDQGQASLSLTTESKTYLNRLLATDTVSSHYRVQNLNLGFSGNRYSDYFGGAVSSLQINWVTGGLSFLQDNPANYGVYTPKRYSKLSVSVSRAQALKPGVNTLMISASGQWASDNLNSAEQFYLGGPYGVRAYPVAQGGGSSGALLTVEYQHRLPLGLFGTAFVDAGTIQQYRTTYEGWQGNTQAGNSYSLYGSGLGLRWAGQALTVTATAAWKLGTNPLLNQLGQALDVENRNSPARLWATANMRF